MFCRCLSPVNVKDIIESFSEITHEEEEEKEIFKTRSIPTNPFSMLGVNIPSFYGGLQV
jgi:hypothetical protein